MFFRVPDLTNTKSMIAECKEANHLFCDWYGYGDDLGAGVIIFCIAAILLMLDLFVLYKLG